MQGSAAAVERTLTQAKAMDDLLDEEVVLSDFAIRQLELCAGEERRGSQHSKVSKVRKAASDSLQSLLCCAKSAGCAVPAGSTSNGGLDSNRERLRHGAWVHGMVHSRTGPGSSG